MREVAGGPYAPHGYADPRGLKTHFQYDAVPTTPLPTTPTVACRFDLARVEIALDAMGRALSALTSEVNATRERVNAANAAAEQARDEVRRLSGNGHPAPPVYTSNRLPVIGTITLRPQPVLSERRQIEGLALSEGPRVEGP